VNHSSGLADGSRRHELARFLKAKRATIGPERFSLPSLPRRRVGGLRREEVALLCGISVTWYTQLESGAPITVSPALLSRLAEVFALSSLERAYLFALAIDEMHDVVTFLPPLVADATRIAANTFDAEIAHVLRVHRAIKTQIYGALVNDCVDTLRPHLDEAKCPIGFWLHEDLELARRRDAQYDHAAGIHAAFHREIDAIVRIATASGAAAAERIVLASGAYAQTSAELERAFSMWPEMLAS
jgi:transcriptional regulator with XRE-family HTH domain